MCELRVIQIEWEFTFYILCSQALIKSITHKFDAVFTSPVVLFTIME